MNDKELADKVVALGVGMYQPESVGCYESYIANAMDDPDMDGMDLKCFVRDWRVAGALMERMIAGELMIWRQAYDDDSPVWIVETHLTNADGRDESLPRAINEACCEALS